MSQVIDTKKYQYQRTKVRDAKGRALYSANNLDAVSRAMTGMVLDDMKQVMRDNGLTERLTKHVGKSSGHFRMILGQALRAMVKKEERIVIRGIEIKSLDQKVPLPEGYTEEPIVRRSQK